VSAVLAKACTKCGDAKSLDSFRVNARYADGHVTWCKGCEGEYRREHYQRNRERTQAQGAAWHLANKDRRAEASRAAYLANPAAHIARVQTAKDRRPDHYREANKLNQRKRRAERVDVRLRSRVSSQFRYCLATGKGGKTTESLLGYSIAELRTHLERQFLKGMSWENMGQWHIDHIIPLASFTITGADDPELKRAWSLPNLRPLWAADNIRKHAKRETLL
jgi:hypothetical protein